MWTNTCVSLLGKFGLQNKADMKFDNHVPTQKCRNQYLVYLPMMLLELCPQIQIVLHLRKWNHPGRLRPWVLSALEAMMTIANTISLKWLQPESQIREKFKNSKATARRSLRNNIYMCDTCFEDSLFLQVGHCIAALHYGIALQLGIVALHSSSVLQHWIGLSITLVTTYHVRMYICRNMDVYIYILYIYIYIYIYILCCSFRFFLDTCTWTLD